MPRLSKLSHTSFSVTDAERTVRWWNDVLGLVTFDRVAGDDWRGVLLLHEPSGMVVEFQQHDGNPGDRFDPRRTGLDHVGASGRSTSRATASTTLRWSTRSTAPC